MEYPIRGELGVVIKKDVLKAITDSTMDTLNTTISTNYPDHHELDIFI